MVSLLYMPPSNGYSPQNSHTVVLQSRCVNTSQISKNSSKQGHFVYARGSPPGPPPPIIQQGLHPPPRKPLRPPDDFPNKNISRNDLLVRFGIDSALGRMVSRVLIMLMLTQPVYVALGMELEDGTVVLDAQEDVTPVAEEVVAEEPEELLEEEEGVQEETPVAEEDVSQEVLSAEEEEVGSENVDEETETPVNGDKDVVDEVEGDTEEGEEVEGEVAGDSTDEEEEGSELADDEQDEEAGDEVLDDTDGSDTGSSGEGDNTDEETDDSVTENDTTETGGGSSGGGGSDDEEEDTDDVEEADEADEDVSDEVAEDVSESGEETEEVDDEAEDIDGTETGDVEEGQDEEEDGATYVSQNPDSKYVFGEGDCTLVSDGEFYCVAEGPERQQMMGDPRVYSEKDREGDKEIFYFDGVEIQRITNNSYDDFAPMFDEETLRIVWQSMLNDRLQIMVHEIPTNTTRQITTSRQNSSNPSIAGDTVVWQEWVETNWEVMMTDVNNSGAEFEIEQLTDNAVHDMFPAAYDDLITWQSERGSSWEVIVYDLRTQQKHSLEKDEDTKYENPRFVLLFDSKHENGDVETIGYDLDTGEMMELGTKPAPIPLEPLTPKDETPEAVVREVSNESQVRIETDGDDGDGDGSAPNSADAVVDTTIVSGGDVESFPEEVVVTPETVVISPVVPAVSVPEMTEADAEAVVVDTSNDVVL